jgi:hypothetical protein
LVGIRGLCEGLKVNTTLGYLYLFGNHLLDEGNPFVLPILPSYSVGVALLCDALSVNTGLVYLNLRSNDISSAGAQLLLDNLRTEFARERSKLGVVDLQGNRLFATKTAEVGEVATLEGGAGIKTTLEMINEATREITGLIRDQLAENRRHYAWKQRGPYCWFVLGQLLSQEACQELVMPREVIYYILLLIGYEIGVQVSSKEPTIALNVNNL